jgi:prepilin-type N-terminal cleavage/methylation domain-containing protein
MTDRARGGGFTLIEVLVALAIAGLAFGVALPVISESLTGGAAATAEAAAMIEAQSLLARVGQDIGLVDGTLAGHDGDLSWTIEIAPWQPADGTQPGFGVRAHRVAVAVSWPGHNQPQTLRLVTLRLAPRR